MESKEPAQSPQKAKPVRILDLCTGTGCIALLLHALLAPHFDQLRILGIDISPIALNLAQRNLNHNVERGLLTRRAFTDIQFHRANVLGQKNDSVPIVEEILSRHFDNPGILDASSPEFGCDLLISNPPYMSTSDFRNGTTSRSVRLFEPRLALVPPAVDSAMPSGCKAEDIFYHSILALSLKLRTKITVLETGDIMQARRVVEMFHEMNPEKPETFHVEIWPNTEQDLAANGFHPHDGSRGVIIQRRR